MVDAAVAKRKQQGVATMPATVGEYIQSGMMTNQIKQAMSNDKLAQRMARAVINATMMNPGLLKCDSASFMAAVMNAAVLNLAPGPAGLCAIIPYKTTATFQFMYRGLIQLAYRSGEIATIICETVDANDDYEWRPGQPPLHHLAQKPSGEWVKVYFCAGIKGGGWIAPQPWSKAKILTHRDRYSKAHARDKKKSPWATAEEEMAKKTVIINGLKLCPISEETSAAITTYEMAEQGRSVMMAATEDLKNSIPETLNEMVREERERRQANAPTQNGEGEDAEQSAGGDTPMNEENEADFSGSDGSETSSGNVRLQAKKEWEATIVDAVTLGIIENEKKAWDLLLDWCHRGGKRELTAEHYGIGTKKLMAMADDLPVAEKQGDLADAGMSASDIDFGDR